jgi:hypothetical protein
MVADMGLRSAALLLIASCFSLPTTTLSQPYITEDFSCPPGFIVYNDFGSFYPPNCRVDRCYGNPGPCGAGKETVHLSVFSLLGHTVFIVLI